MQKLRVYLVATTILAALPGLALAKTQTTTITREETITKTTDTSSIPILRKIESDRDLGKFDNVLLRSNINLTDFNKGNYTIFAPTNQAFANLDEDSQSDLKSANSNALTAIAEDHIVPGTVYLNDLPGNYAVLYSVSGKPIEVRKLGLNDYYVNGKHIKTNDTNNVGNSVIYKVDGFLSDPDVAVANLKISGKKVSILVPEATKQVITIESQ